MIAFDGKVYEDEFTFTLANTGLDTALGMPLESPTEPAGALESSGSTETPAEAPKPKLASNTGPGGNVSVIRMPANDNKNLDLGSGIDIDQAWSDVKKKLSPKPNLTIVPK